MNTLIIFGKNYPRRIRNNTGTSISGIAPTVSILLGSDYFENTKSLYDNYRIETFDNLLNGNLQAYDSTDTLINPSIASSEFINLSAYMQNHTDEAEYYIPYISTKGPIIPEYTHSQIQNLPPKVGLTVFNRDNNSMMHRTSIGWVEGGAGAQGATGPQGRDSIGIRTTAVISESIWETGMTYTSTLHIPGIRPNDVVSVTATLDQNLLNIIKNNNSTVITNAWCPENDIVIVCAKVI